MKLEDAVAALESEDIDLIKLQIDRITKAITNLSSKNDEIVELLMEEEKTIADIKTWRDTRAIELAKFTEMKMKLESMYRADRDRETRCIQQKCELLEKMNEMKDIKIDESRNDMKDVDIGVKARPQTVKLQKYTITPFTGDYKDWLRFWNQFSVEVDASGISEISKFNYLLELLKGKPKEDILGLPHNEDGYIEAKRILVETYGKDIKITKSIIKDIESLPQLRDITRHSQVHDFYNRLSRCVRTLKTMDKIQNAQSLV